MSDRWCNGPTPVGRERGMASDEARDEVLKLARQLHLLTREYDGTEGFLGESFCESVLGMKREKRGQESVDGYIGDLSVQCKFKWMDSGNKKSRYVSVSENAKFDVLAIMFASREEGSGEVMLLGVWGWEDVRSVIGNGRAYIKDLEKLPQMDLGLR